MRVNSAVIKLVFWTSKVLSDGTSPIMLCVRFNGQSLKSTHFNCHFKDWDAKNECLKKSYPNSNQINKMLQDLKNKAVSKKLEFESSDTPYTSKMIIESLNDDKENANTLYFKPIMQRLFKDRHLKSTTIVCYENVYNVFSSFIGKGDFLITEITNDVLIDFAKTTFERLKNPNTVLAYVSKLCSVMAFANSIELSKHFPKFGNEWVNKHFKKTTHHKAIDEISFNKLEEYYNSMPKDNILKRSSKEFALAFYLCCYTMFGIAPVDGAKLKKESISNCVINNVECWKINTRRSKTNQPLNIIVRKDTSKAEILRHFIETAKDRGDYVFPILNEHYSSEKKMMQCLNYYEGVINANLKKIADELGLEKFGLYSLRHSWATHQLNNGTNIGVIANALGRSVSNIGCYLANLTKDEEFLKIAD